MALTRKTTGHSAPRSRYVPEPAATTTTKTKTKTTKKTTSKKPAGASGSGVKANTSKPRAKPKATGVKGAKVEKKAPAATHHKRKPKVGDKVKGALEKAVGGVEGKPGKKAAGTKKLKGTDGKGGHNAK